MQTTSPDIADLLRAEHDRTRADLGALAETLRQRGWDTARQQLTTVVTDLQAHYACEEHSLFPVLSAYRTMILMDAEHDKLLAQQATLMSQLDAITNDPNAEAKLHEAFEDFCAQISGHMHEEEGGLLKMAETVLEPEERALAGRKFQELRARIDAGDVAALALLARPAPHFAVTATMLLDASEKPIRYVKTFEAEHASLHQLQLREGASLAEHWAGQHQVFTVLSGSVRFTANGQTEILTVGAQVQADPGLRVALTAETDAVLLVMKVWPLPHFVRA